MCPARELAEAVSSMGRSDPEDKPTLLNLRRTQAGEASRSLVEALVTFSTLLEAGRCRFSCAGSRSKSRASADPKRD